MAKLKEERRILDYIFYDKNGEIIYSESKSFPIKTTVSDILSHGRRIKPPIAYAAKIIITF